MPCPSLLTEVTKIKAIPISKKLTVCHRAQGKEAVTKGVRVVSRAAGWKDNLLPKETSVEVFFSQLY